jgi:mannose-6-phosphate isomerase-like protein (cupin superfamily)
MMLFATQKLPPVPDVTAPDGSLVRVLLALPGGSMAHFTLAAGAVSRAVHHRTVDEIWFIVSGRGEMWRAQAGQPDEIVALEPGLCLTIPAGTRFQFRASATGRLTAVAVTMPPWPGEQEAEVVSGNWPATVG